MFAGGGDLGLDLCEPGRVVEQLAIDRLELGAGIAGEEMDLTIEGGMGGIEMMRELRRRDPAVRAIVSSGYADSPAMARPADYGFNAVLPKPYPPRELLRVVSESLSGGEVGG